MVVGGKVHSKKKLVGFHQIMFENINLKVDIQKTLNHSELKIFNLILGDTNINNKVLPVDLIEQLRANRAVVVMDIVESEKAHVTELRTLIQSFLIPLKDSRM